MCRILLLFSFLFTFSLNAQSVVLSETAHNFRAGYLNSLVIEIPVANKKLILSELRKEMKTWGGKMSNKRGEVLVTLGSLKELGSEYFDATAMIIENSDQPIAVAISFKTGETYLNSQNKPLQVADLNVKLRAFGVRVAQLGVDKEIKLQEKNLSKLEKQQKSLENEKLTLEKNIISHEKGIEDAKKKLEDNAKNQELKKEAIVLQRQSVESTKAKKVSIQ